MRDTADHPGEGRVSLPVGVEELLVSVAADGFTVYCCGLRHAPTALAACYEWQNYVDLLTIGDFDRVTAARVPRVPSLDIFAPTVVVWAYEGPPQPTLRALLELVHPAQALLRSPMAASGRLCWRCQVVWCRV